MPPDEPLSSLPLPDDRADILEQPEVRAWNKKNLYRSPRKEFEDDGYRLYFANSEDAVKFALMWDLASFDRD